jgi:glutathione S-transferase
MSMKLWYSPASPFVRKVLVFAHEAGLADSIALVPPPMTKTFFALRVVKCITRGD